jgi:hypothetical protein
MVLKEDHLTIKRFNKEEMFIMMLLSATGSQDVMAVTSYFKNKEESTKRLMDALKGRSIIP